MSLESLAVVLHHAKARGTDKLVLVGIANHDGDGGAWPSVATLARYANVEERNVQRALKRLEKAGEVRIHVQAGGPSGVPEWRRPNRYEVLVECPVTCDRTRNHRPRPLPTAPADLWMEGVAPASPGGASVTGGVAPASPGGVAPASPEPSLEPTLNSEVVSQPQTARDLLGPAPACSVCSRSRLQCEARVRVSGHEYTPKAHNCHGIGRCACSPRSAS